MQRFTDLDVWKRSHALTLTVYGLTRQFPKEERYGLASQLRRSASSVPMNIAEGSKVVSNKRYAWHLNAGEASLAETEYAIMLARDLSYISTEQATPVLTEITNIARMLHSLRVKVEQGTGKGQA
jgi:four helix bundle protein